MPPRVTLSTSDARREVVLDAAITEFAKTGYRGTPISAVAASAGISQAYVFKLFPSKVELFVAALERCFDLVQQSFATGARRAGDADPDTILYEMGGAYAELIADKRLLTLQVHALSAADVPEIAEALRGGVARTTDFAATHSKARGEQVQHFIAFGQLCHLVATLDLDSRDEQWAATLSAGIRHPAPTDSPAQ